DAVSPETPALTISTAWPLALRARSSRAGNASAADSPRPAVSESPSATILTIRSVARTGPASPSSSSPVQHPAAMRWTQRQRFPYEGHMNDTSVGGESAITLTGVNLSLGRGAARVHILKDIDLHIGHGAAVGLVGPSGSGKSTLLMVAAGLERPDTGAVHVAGQDLPALDEDALARFRGKNIGILFQSFHLIPTMTALENVAVPLELAGEADAFDR